MKTLYIFILGVVLSLIGLIVVVNKIENGDINSIGMSMVVFLFPILIIAFTNGLFLNTAEKLKNIILKRLFSLIPILLLLLIAQIKNFGINLIDGDLSFLGKICVVTITITNLIWNIVISVKRT